VLEPIDSAALPILCAIFLSSPWILYQVWAFISPGLYRRERRWAAPFILTAAGLFIVGRNPKNVVNLFVGGTIAGSGVAIMHYTGMGAMRMQAIIEWDPTIVAVSVGIAIAAATAALWLTFHTQHLIQRVAAALVMAIAVCGMHYTGMYAGTYVCVAESAATHSSLSIGGSVFPYLVAIVGASLLTAVSILDALALPEPNPAWG